MKFVLIAFVAALLAGCAGLGPTQADNWPQLVSRAIPAADGATRLVSVVEWFPDTLVPTYMEGPRAGVFVVSGVAIEFLQWDGSQRVYHVVFREPFSQIARCNTARTGAIGERLTILQTNSRYQTFVLTGPNNGFVDKSAMSRALALINSSVKGGCEREPAPIASR